jgi:DNA-cytosine methyltransferase
MHALNIIDILKGNYEGRIPVAPWQEKTARDTRHRPQNPFSILKTILSSGEIKRRSTMWKVIANKYVLSDPSLFCKAVKDPEERERLLTKHTTACYLRRLSHLEEMRFQGISFLNFPEKWCDTMVHTLIGNSFPPRVAACIYKAIDDVQKLRTDLTSDPKSSNRDSDDSTDEEIREFDGWNKKTIMDLFAGLGGMSMGVDYVDAWCPHLTREISKKKKKKESTEGYLKEPLGFQHVALVDFNENCIEMLRNVEANRNHYFWEKENVVHADASSCEYSAFRGEIGLLVGGPPCQPFSLAGYRKGFDDPRQGWFICARALLDTLAEAFVFENVKSMVKGEMGKHAVEEIRTMLHDPYNYFARKSKNSGEVVADAVEECPYVWVVQHKIISCSDYGVPQRRERCLFVGFRVKRTTTLSVTCPIFKVFEFMEKYSVPDKRTIWEVIRDDAKENDKLASVSKTMVKRKSKMAMASSVAKKKKGSDPRLWRLVPNEYRGIVK